jgi:hypothetical protein
MERLDPKKTIDIDGRTWTLTRAGPEEQFEIECILLRLLGPAAAVGVGVVVDALAKEVAVFLADVTGKGGDFDLANLLGDIDTSDKRIRKAWQRFLAILPEVAGSLLGEALPVFLHRLDVADLHRLMVLAVFGKAFVTLPGKQSPAPVTNWKVLAAALTGSSPAVKWRLLAEALAFIYADDVARVNGFMHRDEPIEVAAG